MGAVPGRELTLTMYFALLQAPNTGGIKTLSYSSHPGIVGNCTAAPHKKRMLRAAS